MRMLLCGFAIAVGTFSNAPVLAVDRDGVVLVDGVLARETRVFSGRFRYRLVKTRQIGNSKDVVVLEDSEHKFEFMGDSWIDREKLCEKVKGIGYLNGENVFANHRGSYIEYSETSADGNNTSVSRSATVKGTRSLRRQKEPPPYFAGTIWHKSTVEYVKTNRDKVRVMGSRTFEGRETEVLEWDVSPSDVGKAFGSVTDEMIEDGGLLRLYVAPKLGYALPRIEHLTRSEVVQATYEGKDFHKISERLFIPNEISRKMWSSNGNVVFGWEYVFNEIDGINEPIDEGCFVFEIPGGTPVSDLRGRGRPGILIPSSTESQSVEEIMKGKVGGAPEYWNWRVLGTSAMAMLAVLVILGWSFRRSRKVK